MASCPPRSNQNRLLGDCARTRGEHQCPPAGSGRWDQRFADLLAFKAAHGHCNVPSTYKEDPSLAAWVFNCRRQRKLGSLAANRIERLDAIGFSWSVRTRRSRGSGLGCYGSPVEGIPP